jgi:hypothetical protein
MNGETPTISPTDEAPALGSPAELLRGLGDPHADRWGVAPVSASADEIAWRRAWQAISSCRLVAELAARHPCYRKDSPR